MKFESNSSLMMRPLSYNQENKYFLNVTCRCLLSLCMELYSIQSAHLFAYSAWRVQTFGALELNSLQKAVNKSISPLLQCWSCFVAKTQWICHLGCCFLGRESFCHLCTSWKCITVNDQYRFWNMCFTTFDVFWVFVSTSVNVYFQCNISSIYISLYSILLYLWRRKDKWTCDVRQSALGANKESRVLDC